MEVLLTKHPNITNIHCKSVNDYYSRFIESADKLNIATGFVSNESIVEIKRILDYRKGEMCISLFIGMDYIQGFTKLQYNAIVNLNEYLQNQNVGSIFLSPKALFHGKMYSFLLRNECMGAFVGSSNLGSFVGTSQNYIESDVLFDGKDADVVNSKINQIINNLGVDFNSIPQLTKFKEQDNRLLDGYDYVTKLTESDQRRAKQNRFGNIIEIPLKAEGKSNLNTYFGAGKIKGRYSPRGWYEVEIIVSKKTPNIDELPNKEDGPFVVITEDGYEFACERQGDYSKNLRSAKDLKILGRWIKGKMECDGALELGEPVTEDTLKKFGKNKLLLQKTLDDKWFMSLG